MVAIAYVLASELCLVVMDGIAKWVMAGLPIAQVIFLRATLHRVTR